MTKAQEILNLLEDTAADSKFAAIQKEIAIAHNDWDNIAIALEREEDESSPDQDAIDGYKDSIKGVKKHIQDLKIQANKIKPGHYKDPAAYGR